MWVENCGDHVTVKPGTEPSVQLPGEMWREKERKKNGKEMKMTLLYVLVSSKKEAERQLLG